ncbi:hypothetical protein SDC9_108607 [bioreactor metagenome]|uniref:Chromate transport protein n=1 Tax=bioreactor metagenome TaxID=1076179 RepID=A0A645B8L9_9ZZZZ
MKKGLKFYLSLFYYTFKLSAFTFGGGYVIVPLMKKQFVEKLGWIDEKEMLDFIAIAQSTPGAMAVNTSILIGYHLASIPGALITLLGTVTPPLIIITVISFFYEAFSSNKIVANVLHGMQSGVCAVIIDAVIGMGRNVVKLKKAVPILIMIFSFIAVVAFKINVIIIIIACALIGLANMFITRKKEQRHDLS